MAFIKDFKVLHQSLLTSVDANSFSESFLYVFSFTGVYTLLPYFEIAYICSYPR